MMFPVKNWTIVVYFIFLFLLTGIQALNENCSLNCKRSNLFGGRKALLSWKKPSEDTISHYLRSLQKIEYKKPKGNEKREEQKCNVNRGIIPCNHNFDGITLHWMRLNQPLLLSLEHFFENNDYDYKVFESKNIENLEHITENRKRKIAHKMKIKNSYRYVYLSQEIGYGKKLYETLVDHLISWQIHESSPDTKIYTLTRSKISSPQLSNSFSVDGKEEKCLPPSKEKDPLVTLAKITPFGGWILNPCRVSYVEKNKRLLNSSREIQSKGNAIAGQYSAIAYMTLKGHLLQGEEGIRVRLIQRNLEDEIDGSKSKRRSILNLFPFRNDGITFLKVKERRKKNLSRYKDEVVVVDLLSIAKGRNSFVNWVVFPAVKGLQHHFFKEQIKSLQHLAKLQKEK